MCIYVSLGMVPPCLAGACVNVGRAALPAASDLPTTNRLPLPPHPPFPQLWSYKLLRGYRKQHRAGEQLAGAKKDA